MKKNNIQFSPKSLINLGLLGPILMFSGCSIFKPSSDKTRLFILGPSREETTRVSTQHLLVAIVISNFPEYIDRPQIVTKIKKNEIKNDRLRRWSIPLKDSVQNIVASTLRDNFSKIDIVQFPEDNISRCNYRILVDVQELIADETANVLRFFGNWSVLNQSQEKIHSSSFSFEEKLSAGRDKFEDIVEKTETVLQKFAKTIVKNFDLVLLSEEGKNT